MLPPAMIQYVSLKVFTQLTDTGECRGDLITANVLVIAFSGFIVVADNAHIIFNVSQPVFIFMLACPYRGINKPDNDFHETSVREVLFAFGDKFCAHDGEYYITILVMSKTPPLDHLISGSYTVCAPYKTGVGCRNPESITAHNRAFAVFLCVKHGHIRIMVGRAGQPQGWPGSVMTGIPTPVRLTTYQTVGSLGGELSKFITEAAIMATIPTLDHPEFSREDLTPLRHADHLNIILDTMQYLSTRSSADARIQLVRLLLVARTHGQKLREELFRIENNTTLTPSTPAITRGQK